MAGKHEEQRQCNTTWGRLCVDRSLAVNSTNDLPHICGIWGAHRTHVCDFCHQPQAK